MPEPVDQYQPGPAPASYTPLRDPDDTKAIPGSLFEALRAAQTLLPEAAAANIHDHNEMIRTAVGLEHRLRNLIAAVTAEAGTSPTAITTARKR